MKVWTYRLFKKYCELYSYMTFMTQLLLTVVRSNLHQKMLFYILLSKVSIIVYKAGRRTGVENNKFIHFNLLVGIYSIDNFNTKIKVAI